MLSIYLQMLDSEEDRGRFAKLYTDHKDLMYRVALKLLGNEMDAEDAVHQAFLAVLKHFSKIRKIDAPETRAYLVVITESKAVDVLRERKRTSDADPEDLACSEYGVLPGNTGLGDAMLRLPRRYRDALLLRYLHGYSAAELASLWGIKADSARKTLWRAKQALKEEMEEKTG